MLLKQNSKNYTNEDFNKLFEISQYFINDLLFITEIDDIELKNALLISTIENYQNILKDLNIIR